MAIRHEFKIGLIAAISFILLYLGINFLKGVDLFSKTTEYYADFEELNGISRATPVMINGYKVGSVKRVQFGFSEQEGYGARLTVAIDPEIRIPNGSILRVKTSLLSGSELVIDTKHRTEGFIPSGSKLPSAPPEADIMDMAREKVLPATADIMPKIALLLDNLNAIVSDGKIDSTITELHLTSQELTQTMRKLNQSVGDLPTIMSNASEMTASFAKTGKNLEQIQLEPMIQNLESTTADLKAITQQIRSGDGTVGKLLGDPSLYNRIDSLASSADSLLRDIKAHPKRYVKLSLF